MSNRIQRVADGRPDFVFEHVAGGLPAAAQDADGAALHAHWQRCHGRFRVRSDSTAMKESLVGLPHPRGDTPNR